jgi:antibiotic biosynthesis monooxygenase (ABM) superfamily enzyme
MDQKAKWQNMNSNFEENQNVEQFIFFFFKKTFDTKMIAKWYAQILLWFALYLLTNITNYAHTIVLNSHIICKPTSTIFHVRSPNEATWTTMENGSKCGVPT